MGSWLHARWLHVQNGHFLQGIGQQWPACENRGRHGNVSPARLHATLQAQHAEAANEAHLKYRPSPSWVVRKSKQLLARDTRRYGTTIQNASVRQKWAHHANRSHAAPLFRTYSPVKSAGWRRVKLISTLFPQKWNKHSVFNAPSNQPQISYTLSKTQNIYSTGFWGFGVLGFWILAAT